MRKVTNAQSKLWKQALILFESMPFSSVQPKGTSKTVVCWLVLEGKGDVVGDVLVGPRGKGGRSGGRVQGVTFLHSGCPKAQFAGYS